MGNSNVFLSVPIFMDERSATVNPCRAATCEISRARGRDDRPRHWVLSSASRPNSKPSAMHPYVNPAGKGNPGISKASLPGSAAIAPGKTGVIIAQVDTDKTGVGSVVKTVNIVSNADPSVKVVTIKATVLKN